MSSIDYLMPSWILFIGAIYLKKWLRVQCHQFLSLELHVSAQLLQTSLIEEQRYFKFTGSGAEEMAQQVRILVFLEEDQDSDLNSYLTAR